MKKILSLIVFILLTAPSLADIQVRFNEGAPKDLFTIENASECDLESTSLSIDLSGSPYGLIFDLTGTGAGVGVFQPFELVNGGDNLRRPPRVQDGDNLITLELVGLKVGKTLSFTIDVDDTKKTREITVSNSELMGSKIVAKTAGERSEASFQDNNIAAITFQSCNS